MNVTGNDVQFLSVRTNMKAAGFLHFILLGALLMPIIFPEHRSNMAPYTWIVLGIMMIYGLYNMIFRSNKSLIVEKDSKNIFSA